MKHGMKGSGHGKIDLSKPGLGVGGYSHGGTMTEGRFKTPFPKDTSDYYGEGEYGKNLSEAASGAAGGYPASTKGGKK